jgi:hypothetical protein
VLIPDVPLVKDVEGQALSAIPLVAFLSNLEDCVEGYDRTKRDPNFDEWEKLESRSPPLVKTWCFTATIADRPIDSEALKKKPG